MTCVDCVTSPAFIFTYLLCLGFVPLLAWLGNRMTHGERSPIAWFALALVISPLLATILLVIMLIWDGYRQTQFRTMVAASASISDPPLEPEAPRTIPCPSCGKQIYYRATTCHWCKTTVDHPSPKGNAAEPTSGSLNPEERAAVKLATERGLVDTGSVKSSIIEPRGPGEDLVDVWVRLGVLTPGQAEFLRGAVGNHISQQSKERNERIGAEAVRRMMITEEQLGSILAETETGDASTIEELLVQRSLITGAQCAAILESVEPPPVTAKAPAKFNAPKRRAADATDAAEWYHCRICARKGMLVALEPLSAKCPSCGGRRTTGELAGQCRFCLKRGKHVELLVEKVRCSVCRNQREVFSDGMTVESFQAGVG